MFNIQPSKLFDYLFLKIVELVPKITRKKQNLSNIFLSCLNSQMNPVISKRLKL